MKAPNVVKIYVGKYKGIAERMLEYRTRKAQIEYLDRIIPPLTERLEPKGRAWAELEDMLGRKTSVHLLNEKSAPSSATSLSTANTAVSPISMTDAAAKTKLKAQIRALNEVIHNKNAERILNASQKEKIIFYLRYKLVCSLHETKSSSWRYHPISFNDFGIYDDAITEFEHFSQKKQKKLKHLSKKDRNKELGDRFSCLNHVAKRRLRNLHLVQQRVVDEENGKILASIVDDWNHITGELLKIRYRLMFDASVGKSNWNDEILEKVD